MGFSASSVTLAMYKIGYHLLYKWIKSSDQLPWHTHKIPRALTAIMQKVQLPACALDIGCGAGKISIVLAEHGYMVTGLDFIGDALVFARKDAAAAGQKIDFIEADFLAWKPHRQYDVVFDAGCLHGISGALRERYREQVIESLKPGGDYVLIHFEKRHRFDYRPFGPHRVSRQEINRFFEPHLTEIDYESVQVSQPFPIGPVVSVGTYWFRKKG